MLKVELRFSNKHHTTIESGVVTPGATKLPVTTKLQAEQDIGEGSPVKQRFRVSFPVSQLSGSADVAVYAFSSQRTW
ncbi:MAG: hypothetical protein ABGZ53_25405 [Fuerstiella sp.]